MCQFLSTFWLTGIQAADTDWLWWTHKNGKGKETNTEAETGAGALWTDEANERGFLFSPAGFCQTLRKSLFESTVNDFSLLWILYLQCKWTNLLWIMAVRTYVWTLALLKVQTVEIEASLSHVYSHYPSGLYERCKNTFSEEIKWQAADTDVHLTPDCCYRHRWS